MPIFFCRVIKANCCIIQVFTLLYPSPVFIFSSTFSLCGCTSGSVCVHTLVCVSHLDFSVNATRLQRTLGHRAQLGREMKHSWG